MKNRLAPLYRMIDGKKYTLTITRVSKKTAMAEAKRCRDNSKGWGLPTRVVREPDGKYCVYCLIPTRR